MVILRYFLQSNGIHQLGRLLVGQAADASDLVDMGAEAEAELADKFHGGAAGRGKCG